MPIFRIHTIRITKSILDSTNTSTKSECGNRRATEYLTSTSHQTIESLQLSCSCRNACKWMEPIENLNLIGIEIDFLPSADAVIAFLSIHFSSHELWKIIISAIFPWKRRKKRTMAHRINRWSFVRSTSICSHLQSIFFFNHNSFLIQWLFIRRRAVEKSSMFCWRDEQIEMAMNANSIEPKRLRAAAAMAIGQSEELRINENKRELKFTSIFFFCIS